jgi:cytochrome c oxidase subunit 2
VKNLRVIGQKWNWTVQYPEEDISVSGQGVEIGIPLGQPVQLVMSSQDVLHSFFVPNFRVKQDVVPGRYTTLWFEATEVGEFPVFCAEYCGDAHSNMMAKIKVMPVEEYKAWVEKIKGANSKLSPKELGQKLYTSKACNACHTVDGSPKIAPSFKGIYGKMEALEGGGSVKVDDNYIRESILEPHAKLAKGFPPVMPTFKGQLSEIEINGLIEFIKSLK